MHRWRAIEGHLFETNARVPVRLYNINKTGKVKYVKRNNQASVYYFVIHFHFQRNELTTYINIINLFPTLFPTLSVRTLNVHSYSKVYLFLIYFSAHAWS